MISASYVSLLKPEYGRDGATEVNILRVKAAVGVFSTTQLCVQHLTIEILSY